MRRADRIVLALILAGAAAATVMTLGASASHAVLTDVNDTRGRLDIKEVRNEGSARPRWRVITFRPWTKQEIWDTGFVTINLDTIGTPAVDYYIVVGSTGTDLYAELWRDRASKPDYRVSTVKVWRVGPASVTTQVPLAKMTVGQRRITYGWSVQTMFIGPRCRRVCFDLAPDQGAVQEPLPVVTSPPTPSVTPSSSPSSSPSPSASP